ncbi:hypothetical protein [Bradyrhizobium brasilense]|uniref:hypothetical protein n=1 Tax=Bradyrhizobium brasilense TaxID=1419277 RepID=UPI001E3D8CD3|nr:hypothetical protein [Bradyrhizobium brasilense]
MTDGRSEKELSAIWWASGDDDDYGRIVRLLLLTAQRRDVVRSEEPAVACEARSHSAS